MRFSQISDTKDLISFLERRSLKHPFLYHYTTFDILKCICRSKTWRFGNARNMNDMHEYEVKGYTRGILDKLYSACFSYGDEDNVAMWSMYGIPWEDAIRIRIPIKTIRNWIDNIDGKNILTYEECNGTLEKNSFIADTSNNKHKISIRDICYMEGYVTSPRNMSDCPIGLYECPDACDKCPPKRILWWSQSNKNFDIAIDKQKGIVKPELLGYVKNSAWHHEMETRIVFSITPGNNSSSYKYLDIPIPKNMISDIQISLGPRSTLDADNVKQKLAEILHDDPGTFVDVNNVSDSYYKQHDLLCHLKRHCDYNHQCIVSFKNSAEELEE